MRITDGGNYERSEAGPWVQVSRLGNPLFNEVLIPMAEKDDWNAAHPAGEKSSCQYVQHPELANLLPVLYPKRFPHLEALTAPREDLVAILLTGLPAGIVPGFQNASRQRRLRRHAATERRGAAGERTQPARDPRRRPRRVPERTPGHRRRHEHRAQSASPAPRIPLVNKSYEPDAAVGAIEQGITPLPTRTQATFPYAATPHGGFQFPSDTE